MCLQKPSREQRERKPLRNFPRHTDGNGRTVKQKSLVDRDLIDKTGHAGRARGYLLFSMKLPTAHEPKKERGKGSSG